MTPDTGLLAYRFRGCWIPESLIHILISNDRPDGAGRGGSRYKDRSEEIAASPEHRRIRGYVSSFLIFPFPFSFFFFPDTFAVAGSVSAFSRFT